MVTDSVLLAVAMTAFGTSLLWLALVLYLLHVCIASIREANTVAKGKEDGPESASEGRGDPILPQRPSDEEVPEEILRVAKAFPSEGARILAGARRAHRSGTPWAEIVEGYRAYLEAQEPGVYEQVFLKDPNWGG